MIGTYLRAEIVVEKKEALLAPRAAVLPLSEEAGTAKDAEDKEEAGTTGALFTLKKDHAVKHEVRTGIDDGENVEILLSGDQLKEGDAVVVQCNLELEDSMAAEIEKSASPAQSAKPAE